MDAPTALVRTLGFASVTLLALAWLIGVQGTLSLISNYRRHPEDFPDGAGLGRWIGWTLAAGGASLGLATLAIAGGLLSVGVGGLWAGVTGAAVAAFALRGVAKFRHKAAAGTGGRHPGPAGRR